MPLVFIAKPRFAMAGPSFPETGSKNWHKFRWLCMYECPTIPLWQGNKSLRNATSAGLASRASCLLGLNQKHFLHTLSAVLNCGVSNDSLAHMYVQLPPCKREKGTRPNTIKKSTGKLLAWDLEHLEFNLSTVPPHCAPLGKLLHFSGPEVAYI